MAYEQLLYDVTGGVATVTLNRPEQRNALSTQMLGELVDAMRAGPRRRRRSAPWS